MITRERTGVGARLRGVLRHNAVLLAFVGSLAACPSAPTTLEVRLEFDRTTALADGADAVSVVATVTDAEGPVRREHLTLTVSGRGNALSDDECETDIAGTCAFAIRSSVAEGKRLSIALDDGTQASRTLTFRIPSLDLAQSTVTVTPDHVPANGMDTARIVVTLRNEIGTPVEGVELSVLYSPLATPAPPYATTDAEGQATFTVSSTTPLTAPLAVLVGQDRIAQTPTLTFEAVDWPITGFIEGLVTSGLVLACTGQDPLPIAAGETYFRFSPGLPTNAQYHVEVREQPQGAFCEVTNPDGVVYAGVGGIKVICRSTWADVKAGRAHVLGLRTDGSLWTWGDDTRGALGRGAGADGGTPLPVPGLWRSIAAAKDVSLAFRRDGSLWAWGDNGNLQFGTATTVSSAEPVPVPGAWKAIAVGSSQVLALHDAGALWAWGTDVAGNGGRGDAGLSAVAQVVDPGPFVSVAAADDSFALLEDGGLVGFGPNRFGSLGLGDAVARNTPTRIAGTWKSISAGRDGTLAIAADGTLWGWGPNQFGSLGVGNAMPRLQPVPIPVGAVTSAAIDTVSLWALRDGGVGGAGSNLQGQLGQADTTPRFTATALQLPGPAQALSTSGGATYLVTAAGALYGFGAESKLDARRFTATPAALEGTWAAVSTGPTATVALGRDGAVWGWGAGRDGSLGAGLKTLVPTPALVGTTATGVSMGGGSSAVLGTPGTQLLGQLADGGSRPLGDDTAAVAFGEGFWVRLTSTGQLVARGDNRFGQLGVGDVAPHATEVTVPGDWKAVSTGSAHVLALSADGGLYAWGANDAGQLGTGLGNANRPAQIEGSFVSISAAGRVSYGVTPGGVVLAWGDNTQGQLPFSQRAFVTTPRVVLSSGWSRVGAGPRHTLALKTDNTLWSWGANDFGQRGVTGDAGVEPTQIPGRYKAVSASGNHSLALQTDNRLVGFGLNEWGTLGLAQQPMEPQLVPWRIR